MKRYRIVTMNDRKLSMPLAEAVCLNCGGPLPESRAKTRRYCSASCRTTAYNLRVSERLVPTRDAGDSLLPQWVRAPTGDVPLLTSAKFSLKEVALKLDGLSRRIEAEESALRRDLAGCAHDSRKSKHWNANSRR